MQTCRLSPTNQFNKYKLRNARTDERKNGRYPPVWVKGSTNFPPPGASEQPNKAFRSIIIGSTDPCRPSAKYCTPPTAGTQPKDFYFLRSKQGAVYASLVANSQRSRGSFCAEQPAKSDVSAPEKFSSFLTTGGTEETHSKVRSDPCARATPSGSGPEKRILQRGLRWCSLFTGRKIYRRLPDDRGNLFVAVSDSNHKSNDREPSMYNFDGRSREFRRLSERRCKLPLHRVGNFALLARKFIQYRRSIKGSKLPEIRLPHG